MTARVGIHNEYFSSLELRHDVLVEAGVAAVTEVVAESPSFFGLETFRVENDVGDAGRADGSTVRIYRLTGQAWTQVFSPSNAQKPFQLGKLLSERLATRCLQIEVTDDAWGGHAFFDRGATQELSCFCVGDDLRWLCPKLGLEVPDLEEDELYEEAKFFHSELEIDRKPGKLESLVEHLGVWVDVGDPVGSGTDAVERLDLLLL